MRLVVDANIMFAAMLKEQKKVKILNTEELSRNSPF